MGIITAYNLIRAVAAVHLVFGYFLLVHPQTISSNNAIMILGESLGLQQPKSSFVDNPLACGVAALVLILSAISDLVTITTSEEVARDYWGAQAPLRCFFFSVISIYTYFLRPGRGKVGATSDHPLVNSLVFSWAFMEVIWWFSVFTVLRNERDQAMDRIMQRRQQKAELELAQD